jgi:hypothetical protein
MQYYRPLTTTNRQLRRKRRDIGPPPSGMTTD